ncbi:hypothetical protein lerEdw1_009584, partial [Lerista edwardsae]
EGTRGSTAAIPAVMELIKLLAIVLQLCCASAFRNRIIGGEECSETAHPFLALLYDDKGPYCGATLIREDWVITAAHCYKSEILVKFGMHNLSQPMEHEQVRVGTSKICPNTDDCTNFSDDIMLIQLDSPVAYVDPFVAPLDLATSSVPAGTNCIVTGWGATAVTGDDYPEVPHWVNIPIISYELCEEVYGPLLNEKMLCAGDMDGSKGPCQGDSGGPLICNGKLQGVVSFGSDPCAEPDQPGAYVSICKVLVWILSVIGEN